MKKLITVILLAVMIVSIVPIISINAAPLTADTSWYTDAAYTANGNKYLISDAADLLGFANLLAGVGVSDPVNFDGKNVELTADIDFKDNTWPVLEGAMEDDAARPESRDPLLFTVMQNYGFWGTFDGKGHKISSIQYDGYDSDAVDAHDCCLFGIVPKGKTATVKNLVIETSTIEVSYFSSAIFSTIEGTATIENVYLDESTVVSACGQSIGMLAGRVMPTGNLTIKNCVIAAVHRDTWTKDRFHGGFVAASFGTLSITDCAFYGWMEKGSGSNLQGNAPSPIVRTLGKDATVTDPNYFPSLILKNIIVCGEIADTCIDGKSTGKVTYFMPEPPTGVLTNISNIFYAEVTKPITGLDGTKIEASAIEGDGAATFLTQKGFTTWSATKNYPLPTTLKDIVYKEAATTEAPTEAPTTAVTTAAPTDATTDAATEAPTNAPTAAPSGNATDSGTDTAAANGCGSVIGVTSIAMMIVSAGVALGFVEKKRR